MESTMFGDDDDDDDLVFYVPYNILSHIEIM